MKTVLIIDDEPDLREALKELLELEGYRAEVAANGRAGLESVERFKPDVVVLDLMMPVMTGADFLALLARTTGPRRGVVVASSDPEGAELARRFGCAFIRKPLAFDALLLLLRTPRARAR